VESSIESVVTPVELLDDVETDEVDETEEVVLLELEEEEEVDAGDETEVVREEVDDELKLVEDVKAVVEEVVMFVVEDVACRVARYAPAIITITIMMTATRIIGLLTALSRETRFNFFNYTFWHLRDSNKL